MLPTMDQFTAQVEKAVAEQAEWMKTEFGFDDLPISIKIADVPTGPQGQARIMFKNREFVGFRVKFQSYHFLRDELCAFMEYATYNAWPEIGGFETTDWRLATDALVAHEMAHVAQFAFRIAGKTHPRYIQREEYPKDLFFEGVGRYEGGHSTFFRQIYKRFRNRFVNHRVPASAYNTPKRDFIEGNQFEERMKDKTGVHPLVGIRFMFKGRMLEVAGRNPRNARLFGYMVKLPDGSFSRCKLSLICTFSPEAKEIAMATPWLGMELIELFKADLAKKEANAKSSETKLRRRRNSR